MDSVEFSSKFAGSYSICLLFFLFFIGSDQYWQIHVINYFDMFSKYWRGVNQGTGKARLECLQTGEKNRMSIITKQKSFLLISCRCQTIWHQGRNIKYVNIELSIFTQFWQFLPPWHYSNNCVVTRPSAVLYSTVHVQCTSMSIKIFYYIYRWNLQNSFWYKFFQDFVLKNFQTLQWQKIDKDLPHAFLSYV